ncbi:TPA: hypothetical protein ACX6R1_000882 [Photobacterium damselae]|uniref:hypothetical protein n=1 Tax=Photobacterium damselae TaxID=38293 RepID=UPI00370B29FC
MRLKHLLVLLFCCPSFAQATETPLAIYQTITSANQTQLKGAPVDVTWASSGSIVQGVPRGDAVPMYWAESVNNKSFISQKYWNGISAWFVIYPGSKNRTHNIRVIVDDIEIWVLRAKNDKLDIKNSTWEKINTIPSFPKWAAYYKPNLVTPLKDAPYSKGPNGEFQYQVSKDSYPIHGGIDIQQFSGKYVLTTLVRMRAWLVSDDAKNAESIKKAQYLASVGVDYYPNKDLSVKSGAYAPANYLPGASGSSFKLLTNKPQWFIMVGIAKDDLSNVDKSSLYFQSGGKTYITKEEWLSNPCPLYD